MAANPNAVSTIISVGNREDLEDKIWRVAPEETPFLTNIGTAKAKSIKHDWQTETLATPNPNNAQLEGDVYANDAPNLTTRVENICQIFRKVAETTETEDAVDKAGRDNEMDRQIVLKTKEMKRDMEARFIGNYGSQIESAGSPRMSAGALACIVTNTSLGAGGVNGGFANGSVTAATNGTTRAFTEAQLKAAMAAAFSAGGKPNQIYMGPIQKQEFSSFTGIAQFRKDAPGDKMPTITGAADAYLSDFGLLSAVPHPYGLGRDALGIDPDMWAIGTLRPLGSVMIAKLADSTRKAVITEKTLVYRNERSSFAIRDLS